MQNFIDSLNIKLAIIAIIFSVSIKTTAQVKEINEIIQQKEIESHLRFLAADELLGRDVGTPEIDIAARYIAEQYRKFGVKPLNNSNSYFQEVSLKAMHQPGMASISLEDQKFELSKNLIVINGKNTLIKGSTVFLDSATIIHKELVNGKVVIIDMARFMPRRMELSSELETLGASSLIVLYRSKNFPWERLVKIFSDSPRMQLDYVKEGSGLTSMILNDPDKLILEAFRSSQIKNASIEIRDSKNKITKSRNVYGVIKGTNPKINDEYIIHTAHYDHIGVNSNSEHTDSIYNGARDNAVGVTGLICAAKYFSVHPPERSIILLAVTAEEKGLLGSEWYASHPIIPLAKTIFNLNIDNAGYDDTTKIVIVGSGFTSVDSYVSKSARAFGLESVSDPVPMQNRFRRSDQYSFVKKGVPAINFSMGNTKFAEEVNKYYHKVTDDVESLDLNYITKYLKSFVYCSEILANQKEIPYWLPAVEYKQLGDMLYGKKK